MNIQTQTHQLTAPAPVERDSNDKPIVPGSRVAYNYQGSVILGTVKELRRSEWKQVRPEDNQWWSLRFELVIDADAGHTFTVKNPNSFVIID
jgi:hypothetical protein